ncbi:biotin--[acetyl-CoA-carboxylase] ligase [Corynebacterium casei]|uniref:biotin--[acetyl-CoA-carboxylase] ligase n=1 Tax=Corynebacterium casei TaxID=160386 RepID=UPI003F967B72
MSSASAKSEELDLARIRTDLVESGLYSAVDHTAQTGSTNTDLMQAEVVQDRAVLLADEQVSGKGRLGRVWSAPAKTQIIQSVVLLPRSLDHLGTLPLAAGLAVTDIVEGAQLKWPNDVQIEGKKLCGILAEAGPVGGAASGKGGSFGAASAGEPAARVVLGLGLNVSLSKEQLPIENATSLALEGQETDRTELTIALLTALHKRLKQWVNQDPELMKDYRKVSSSIGMSVRLEAPTGDIYGEVLGVADDGRINVGGQYYSAGDVVHLRPDNR